jgi:hypothetical protein
VLTQQNVGTKIALLQYWQTTAGKFYQQFRENCVSLQQWMKMAA